MLLKRFLRDTSQARHKTSSPGCLPVCSLIPSPDAADTTELQRQAFPQAAETTAALGIVYCGPEREKNCN